MQDEQGNERGTDGGGTGQPEYSELLLKCVQTYRDVTTLRPNNGARVVDYVIG
ncbi:MAG TPA: hypothetical protein VGJ57_00945 [Nitrospirales bacterium]|jgi:hypothetical protein